jgi:hypothetical protein
MGITQDGDGTSLRQISILRNVVLQKIQWRLSVKATF